MTWRLNHKGTKGTKKRRTGDVGMEVNGGSRGVAEGGEAKRVDRFAEADPLTREIIGAAIEVHRALGPGLLESAYHACLCRELEARGVAFESELDLPLVYRGSLVDCAYRIDLLVGGLVVVELKAVEKILPVHEAQLLTYLKLSKKPVGLLFNFNSAYLRDAIVRRVL